MADSMEGADAAGSTEFAKLIQLQGFGGRGGIRDSILFTGENTLVHPVGGHVVQYSMETGRTEFIQKLKNVREVVAMAIAPNLRAVALCERTRDDVRPSGAAAGSGTAADEHDDSKAQVSVYHVASRRKMRTMTLPMKGEFRYCAFSGDNKFLGTVGGFGPDMMLVVWKWNAEKVVAMAKCSPAVTRINFFPRDSTLISMTGPNYIRFWRCTGDHLRELPPVNPKLDAENFVDHAWMGARPAQPGEPLVERRMLALTDTGAIHIFGKQDEGDSPGDTVGVKPKTPAAVEDTAKDTGTGFVVTHNIQVDLPEGKEDAVATVPRCITAYGKGFAIGGTNGLFCVYEKTDDKKEPFIHIKTFAIGDDVVTSMTVAPNDETLVCFSSLSMYRQFPLSMIDTVAKDVDHFKHLIERGIHSRGVVALDVCQQQPVAVTCSTDRTIRVWNYLNWTCDVAYTVNEDPLCVALHPSGMFLAVGSKDRLVLYNVQIRSMSEMMVLPAKQIRAVRFSHGGHFLAASVGLLVQVFSTFTGELVHSFAGHIGAIRQLVWSKDDSIVCSAGEDGHVYAFGLHQAPPPRIEDLCHVVKTCRFTSCALTSDKKSLVSCGRDASGLCILQVVSRNEITTYNTGTCRVMKVAFNADETLLYCGTANGVVRVYQWPLESTGAPAVDPAAAADDDVPNTSVSYALPEPPFMDFPLHQARVTGLSVTPDTLFLLSCSDDGSLFALGIPYAAPVRGGRAPPPGRAPAALTWEPPQAKNYNLEVTLVDRDDMEDSLSRLAAMEKKLDEVKNESEYNIHMKEAQFQEKAAIMTEDTEKAIAAERTRYDGLQSRHETYVREQVELHEKIKTDHARLAQDLQNKYESKLAQEMERYDNLSEQMERVVQTTRTVLQEAQEKQAKQVMALQAMIDEKEMALVELAEQSERDMSNKQARHEEVLRQVEQEYETEIAKLKQGYAKELADEEAKTAQKQGALTSQGNKLESLKKRLLEAKQKCTSKEKECDKLNHKILQLHEQMRNLGCMLEARDSSLLEKEKTIAALRSENCTLENFRFVLDHQITKMSAERGPISEHVTSLEAHIERMFGEMVSEFEGKKATARNLANKDLKIDGFAQEIQSLRASVRDKDREIAAFQAAAEKLLHTDARHLHEAVKDVYHQFVVKNVRGRGPRRQPRAKPVEVPEPAVTLSTAKGGEGVVAAAAAAAAAASGDAAPEGSAPVRKGGTGEVSIKEHQDTVGEIVRQREYLMHNAGSLKRQLNQTTKALTRKAQMATDDNIKLMQEVNDLRRQLVDRDRRLRQVEREFYSATGRLSSDAGSVAGRADTMGSRTEPPTSPIAGPESPAGDKKLFERTAPPKPGKERLSRTMPTSQSATSLSRPYASLKPATQTARPSSVLENQTRVARGSTKSHREALQARQQIDSLKAQLAVQDREMTMQRSEIQRLRDALATTMMQPVAPVSSSGGGLPPV